jgi:hypothetical protein
MAQRNSAPQYVGTAEEAKEAVEGLVLDLKEKLEPECGLRPTEIVMGGSLGHGTALPWKFDADIVIYSEDIETQEVEKSGYDRWLGKIHHFMQKDEDISECYQLQNITAHGLQFIYEGVDMNLLLSPYWVRPGDYFKYLSTISPALRFRFSASAAKWQVQFFKQQSSQSKDLCRDLIKRAKAWRDHTWPRGSGGTGRPSSYLVSLLVAKAFENSQKKMGVFSTMNPDTLALRTTEELKNMLLNHKTLDVYWEHYYSLGHYRSVVPSSVPRIIDPANPSNNLYDTGIGYYCANEKSCDFEQGDGDWTAFKKKIHTVDLTKPMEHWL